MYCSKCSGVGLIILGVLVLGNAWFGIVNWWYAFGSLLLISGILSIAKPDCGCGGGCCMPPMPVKRVNRPSR